MHSASELRGKGDLSNQLQRAALSISNNIDEGFERGTTNELIHYLYLARGSAGEVRSMLCLVERMNLLIAADVATLKENCESISRQIRGWANSLQNSDIQGQRHLNDQSRANYEVAKQRESYLERQRHWRVDYEARLKAAAQRNTIRIVDQPFAADEDGADGST